MLPTRRDILAAGSAAALAGLSGAAEALTPSGRFRTLRIAHISDLHVQPELGAAVGMEQCLNRAQNHRPDVIFMGGDQVMDCLDADKSRCQQQWDLYQRVLRANAGVPVIHCLGNHDIWGWAEYERYKNEPLFGKRMALDRFEADRAYRSFSMGGWHIVVLDSSHSRVGIGPTTNGYFAHLGKEQFEWLKDDLAKTPKNKNILILSHIPILAVCPFFMGPNEESGRWRVPAEWMHLDARRIKNLFKQHPNVRVCISGHMHMVDKVKYLGVTYISHGAASGNWWKGPYQEFKNGYGIVDLYNDGMVEAHYYDYGWTPRK